MQSRTHSETKFHLFNVIKTMFIRRPNGGGLSPLGYSGAHNY